MIRAIYFVSIAIILAQSVTGQNWTQLSLTGTPPVARGLHGTTGVYDPASNRMLVFGGRDSSGNNLNDVWVLTNANGLGGASQWVNLIPNGADGAPPARSGHSAVYDSANNVMIVFGGCSGFCVPALNDVWVLANANGLGGTPAWTQLTPDNPPAPRTNAVAGYDSSQNQLFLYGGQDGSPDPCSTFSDVWSLSNANGMGANPPAWTSVALLSTPQNLPPAPNAASAIYDHATNTMTILGGVDTMDGVCRDTNTLWQLKLGNPLEATFSVAILDGDPGSPAPRSYASAVYDTSGGRMLVFGGAQDGNALNDVWSLSNANGLGGPTWSQLNPSGTPPAARSGQAAVFDAANQRMTVFAGSNASGVLNDTWVLNAPGISAMSCSMNTGSPKLIRIEGLAELVGDILLTCEGGSPTPLGEPIPEYQLTLTLSTNVTSRPLSHGGKLSEALVIIDDAFAANPSPAPPDSPLPEPFQPPQILCAPMGSLCSEHGTGGNPSPYQTQPNVFVGKQTGPNTLTWTIPIDPPGVNLTRSIRLMNVRAAALQVGTPGLTSGWLFATVGIQGADTVSVSNSPGVVAIAGEAITTSVTPANPIYRCVPHNTSLIKGPGEAAFDFNIQLRETWAQVFKVRNFGTQIFGIEFPEPLSEQNLPAFVYNTESGLYSPSLFDLTPNIGLADSGTRIRLKFGPRVGQTRLFVPVTITLAGLYGQDAAAGQLQLVQADQNGDSAPGYKPVRATKLVGSTPVAEVDYFGSAAYAVYEVVYADPTVDETATIPVAVVFNGLPAAAEVGVAPSLAALNASQMASPAAPLPRFASIYATEPAYSIQSCPVSTLSANITDKTGPKNARVWNIQVDNGANPAAGAQMESFNIVRMSGPKCAPSIVSPAFPLALGDIPANGSAATPVTIDFTGCSNATKFKATIRLSSNDGVSNTTVVKNNQAP